ncbi:2OG-Fe dioxygenase family protein [Mastigocladopsis repens]|uniref:2OG-Fe dioxygenase family protein n=1 Tax=Mastigocladopsis repens TaxID=221287 RepID=UPI0002E37983|nr:2OG-Fe dioxygenase family protein [Mastigocladopsis repens]
MLELRKKDFNCLTSYALESISSVDVDKLKPYFINLPVDPYLAGNYRFRRLSHFKISDEGIVKLPHRPFYQAKQYNSLLGDVVREYPELDDELIKMQDFQRIILEFFEFCKLCSTYKEIAVHQIRITASAWQIGKPAPEGIHRDGVDLVGIFSVNRERIAGGESHLYKSKNDSPVFNKILNPGELLVFSDKEFFHFTDAINAMSSESGVRDVFVLTCPGLIPSTNQ